MKGRGRSQAWSPAKQAYESAQSEDVKAPRKLYKRAGEGSVQFIPVRESATRSDTEEQTRHGW